MEITVRYNSEQTSRIKFDTNTPLVAELIDKAREAGVYGGHRPLFSFGGRTFTYYDSLKTLAYFQIRDGASISVSTRSGTCDDSCDISCAHRHEEEKKKRMNRLISLREKLLHPMGNFIQCHICEHKSILGYVLLFDEKMFSQDGQSIKLSSGSELQIQGYQGLSFYEGDAVLISIQRGLQACGTCWKEILTLEETC